MLMIRLMPYIPYFNYESVNLLFSHRSISYHIYNYVYMLDQVVLEFGKLTTNFVYNFSIFTLRNWYDSEFKPSTVLRFRPVFTRDILK